MIKNIVLALIVCLSTVGGMYIAGSGKGLDLTSDSVATDVRDQITTKMIAVPVLRDQKVVGYFLARLQYALVDEAWLRGVPADAFLRHALHSAVHQMSSTDFQSLDKPDMEVLAKAVEENLAKQLFENAFTRIGVVDADFLLRAKS
ncbi:MAG: hypothetical protein AB3N20_14745 [Rhizobiaceae bacterium]